MYTTDLKSTRRKGFTLVELMVAIGVTALLVSMMLTITLNVMGGWNKSSGSLTSGNQARLVLDMAARDLQGAVIKKDSHVWFAASIQQNQTSGGDAGMVNDASWTATGSGVIKPPASDSLSIPAMSGTTPPDLEGYRFGQAGTWLRFFTSITDTNTADTSGASTTDTHVSAPRAVAYQIIRAPVVFGSSEYRYQLFRSEVSSENSFSAGYDLFAAPYNSIAPVTETNVSTTIKGAGIIRRPETAANDRRLVIANNVIDFGVRVYTRNSTTNAVQLAFPLTTAKLGFAATIPSTTVPTPLPTPAPASGAGSYDYGTPFAVEVFMRVLTDEGVLQIDNLENGRITGDWWDIALKNSKVFTRRVELNSNGL